MKSLIRFGCSLSDHGGSHKVRSVLRIGIVFYLKQMGKEVYMKKKVFFVIGYLMVLSFAAALTVPAASASLLTLIVWRELPVSILL